MSKNIKLTNIPDSIYEAIKEESKKQNMTPNKLIKYILEQYDLLSAERKAIYDLNNLVLLQSEIISENSFFIKEILKRVK